MALPNFIGIGAEKAGTTPLFFMIRQHPDIFMFEHKETHFFSRYQNVNSSQYYEFSLFKGYKGHKVIGEISPEYIRRRASHGRSGSCLASSRF